MNRRSLLSSCASVGLCWLAGCTGDSVPETSTTTQERRDVADTTADAPPEVAVSASNASPENPDVQLQVRWRARAQNAIQPANGGAATYAEEGWKWLVVQLAVTNAGDAPWTTTPTPFVVEVDGEPYEIVSTDDDRSLGGTTIESGESTTGHLVFHVPRSATDAVLTVEQTLVADTVAMAFEHDGSLSFPIDT